ncbi:MAG: BamA/TamA family outer membrane protein, partial [Acidobacteriota bacterium]|nr:BamA/TamA family outer membrane protein [Acidobacteriota bacterium]
TGVEISWTRPFSFYPRGSLGVGYTIRDIDVQSFAAVDIDPDEEIPPGVSVDPGTGQAFVPIIEPREDDFPIVHGDVVGDTTIFAPWGPVRGHRYRLYADYAPDPDESGTLTATITGDIRTYIPMTARSGWAFRLWGGKSNGNFPRQFYIGGFDTIRGFEFRELIGDSAFYGNIELRFPLIDVLAFPPIAFQGIRGRFFFDVGGAWFSDIQSFKFWDGDNDKLDDAVASFGFGITVRLFGLDLNWDFSQITDFEETGDRRTSFWIGQRF